MDAVLFLGPALVLSVLLVSIHSYLGLHVLKREVLFIDISLSQISVLGSSFSLFYFNEPSLGIQTIFSLIFCFFISLFFAWIKQKQQFISQEVIIGVTYAAASGFLILFLEKLPQGTEHLKEALAGNILFVTWDQVFVTLFVYLFVGLFHWYCRHQFWLVSEGKLKSFIWDFFFYLLFGVVITFSTQHAGVLVVFSMLVVPAALGIRFFQSKKKQWCFALTMGIITSLLGFFLSTQLDLPAGPTLVAVFSIIFFIILIYSILIKNKVELNSSTHLRE